MDSVDKKQLSEEDIKRLYITPAIEAVWPKTSIRMEFYINAGRIIIDGKKAKRDKKKIWKADYILFHNDSGSWFPIAIVEAKDNNSSVIGGMGQARQYAKAMKVPFAFSSNGDFFAMYNDFTGFETDVGNYIPMDKFPSPGELWSLYKRESKISDSAETLLDTPYYFQEGMHEPRYYQWIAINKVLSAIADGQKRMLIVLATGTGKTLVAFHIIWRLLKAKKIRRALFLADRDVLLSQPMRDDFSPFGNKMFRIENRNMDTTHEVYLSLYHQMKKGDVNYYTAYDRDFFDLVIVDECHRGSADDDSSWHEILEYFNSAIQVGMTATPKETEDTSNIEYFGDGVSKKPLYTYSLKQGIQDGFLAPYKVIKVNLDIDVNGFRPWPGMKDIYGEPVEDRLYEQKDFDRKIVVPERTQTVARRVTEYLKESDRFDKTIIFCEDIEHAQRMCTAMNNENTDIVAADGEKPYIVRITSNSVDAAYLDDFTDPHEAMPVVAVTSRLMSTGVNSQTCKLVVLDRTVNSMTEFKQIIGRGTRVREDCDKLYFTIMDFRKNYVKFADPAFDGEPVVIKEYGEDDPFDGEDDPVIDGSDPAWDGDDGEPEGEGETDGGEDGWIDGEDSNDERRKRGKRQKIYVDGILVTIINEMVEFLDANGNLITMSIIEYSRNNLQRVYPYFDTFREVWMAQKKKDDLLQKLVSEGVFVDYVKETLPIDNIDDYDVLSYIGYSIEPLTKDERIDRILASGYLDKFSPENQDIIRLLLDAYRDHDIDELKNMRILNMPEFIQKGTAPAIVNSFGGKDKYLEMLAEIEEQIYAA